jgi:GNAT superfamily N-acetyltransferase
MVTEVSEGFAVAPASLSDWDEVVEWAAQEGWNPGLGDAACFHAADPAGFFVGRLGGRIVSAVSVVTYSPEYAFLGFYLVHPDHRGAGLGLATWTAALPHAGNRVIGLDAVPAQQATYLRAGFTPAYANVRFTGRPRPPATPSSPPSGSVLRVDATHLPALAAYDRTCFPASRRAFLDAWLTAPGHTARVLLHDGAVAGYGVIRPAREGHRVGPLFADTPEVATALFDALTVDSADVTIDVPDLHPAAAFLAERGLTPTSTCTRMYTGPVPPTHTHRVFATTTLELG